jgi:fatty-acyl-CoA synthase
VIRLWKGFHSHELLRQLEESWLKDQLLISCPPLLKDFSFLPLLPSGQIELCGEWEPEAHELLRSEQSKRASRPEITYPANAVLGVFTTGTVSGSPRLILYSKANVEASLSGIGEFFDSSRIRAIYCYPQPFHTFGLILGYMQAILRDARLVIPPGRYCHAFHELRAGLKDSALLTLGTPTHFHDLWEYVQRFDHRMAASYSSVAGGAKVSCSLWRTMKEKLRIDAPSIGYGATEASPGITHLPPGLEPLEDGEVGFPLTNISTRLLSGQGVEIEGPGVCLAVIHKGEIDFPKALIIRDELHRRAGDGVLVYRGRTELTLNRGGQKFSLERIEEILKSRLSLEALCVPLPDERLGEDLGILVRSTSGQVTEAERKQISQTLLEVLGNGFNTGRVAGITDFPLSENLKVDRRRSARFLNE